MLFNSIEFVVFAIAVLAVHFAIPRGRWRARKVFLVIASYASYTSWNPFFGLLLLGSTLIDFTLRLLLARATGRAVRRALLGVSLAFNLGMLGYFKYGNFVAENVGRLLRLAEPLHLDADRHLLLHLRVARLLDQRVSRGGAVPEPARLRALPIVLPAPGRGADRAAARVPAAARRPADDRREPR
jgi:hypothetical protein